MDLSSFLASVSDTTAAFSGSQILNCSLIVAFGIMFVIGAVFISRQVRPSQQPSVADILDPWIVASLMGLVGGVWTFIILWVQSIVDTTLWMAAGIVLVVGVVLLLCAFGARLVEKRAESHDDIDHAL